MLRCLNWKWQLNQLTDLQLWWMSQSSNGRESNSRLRRLSLIRSYETRGGHVNFTEIKLLQCKHFWREKFLIPWPPYLPLPLRHLRPFIEELRWKFTAIKANLNVIYVTISYLHTRFIHILFKLQSQANLCLLFYLPVCVYNKYMSEWSTFLKRVLKSSFISFMNIN